MAKPHYHVNAIGGNTAVNGVVCKNLGEAESQLSSMVSFLRSVTGSFVMEDGERRVKLSDNTVVRIKECRSCCLPD